MNDNVKFPKIARSLADIDYDVDGNGMPIITDEQYAEFDSMLLDPSTKEGRSKIHEIAQQAFDIWDRNNREQVDLSTMDCKTPCSEGTPKQTQIFVDDLPERDDYDTDEEMEFADNHVFLGHLKAKKMCAQCPLQSACVSSSLTNPVYNRSRELDPNRINMHEGGIWGGFGDSARSMILKEFVNIWIEADGEQVEGVASVEDDDTITENMRIDEAIRMASMSFSPEREKMTV